MAFEHSIRSVLPICILLAAALLLAAAPRVEAADFTVNSPADAVDALPGDGQCATLAGQCTLRAAIQEANARAGSDGVTLPAGTYLLALAGPGEDAAAAGDLDITDDLTVTGAGAAVTIVDGGGLDRVLHVDPLLTGVAATVSGITVQNGFTAADTGGGILNRGALTLTDSVVTENATGGNSAGIHNSGTLVVERSTVSRNVGQANGGGIMNFGDLSVTDAVISDNAADGNLGGVGGPVGSVSLTRVTVSGNSAGLDGGGVVIGGTGTVVDSVIRDNAAQAFGGGLASLGAASLIGVVVSGNSSGANGGGIANLGALASMTIADSEISDNAASPDTACGGGIFNSGTLIVEDTEVLGNTARICGGIGNVEELVAARNTISDNETVGAAGVLGGAGIGQLDGAALVVDSTISGNRTGGTGGGIGAFGTITVDGSTIEGNFSTGLGGGGIASGGGSFSVSNSTISGNGAIRNGGGIAAAAGMLSLNNVTLTENEADADGDGDGNGGAVSSAGGVISAGNTIIGGNRDPGGEAPDCSGPISSLGYNLIGSAAGCVVLGDATGNVTGQDPALAPLADNGGPTRTHALLPGSPAIDAGNPAPPGSGGGACEAADQRGVPRPQDGDGNGDERCDIGAYERDPALPPPPPAGGGKATGGGWLAADDGSKIHFGFVAKEKGDEPGGKLQLRDKGADVKAHLSQVTAIGAVVGPCGSIGPGPDALEIRGTGTFDGADGAEFRVCVEDNGEPGSGATPDRFYLECVSGCTYDTGSRTPDDALDGGNIQVHEPAAE